MAAYLTRSCATCGGHWLPGQTTSAPMGPPGGGEPWLCPKHEAIRAAKAAAWIPAERDRCHRIGRTTGPFSELFVIAVHGDQVTVQPIGFPERRETVHTAELEPGRFGVR